jgi:serine/threonine protein phosphatase PrpC
VGGQIASARAAEAFAAHAATSDGPVAERLRGALAAANEALAAAVAAEPRLSGMGSTLVGAVVDGRRVDWISVGDSLLLAVEGGEVRRLNADHSVGGVLDGRAERGEITPAQAAASDQRHLLRSVLIGEPIPMIDTGSIVLSERAKLVVASDGVLTLGFARLAEIVSSAASLGDATAKIVAAVDALMIEHQDNMTVAVVAPGGGPVEAVAAAAEPAPEPVAAPMTDPVPAPVRRVRPGAPAMLAFAMLVVAGVGLAAYLLYPSAPVATRAQPRAPMAPLADTATMPPPAAATAAPAPVPPPPVAAPPVSPIAEQPVRRDQTRPPAPKRASGPPAPVPGATPGAAASGQPAAAAKPATDPAPAPQGPDKPAAKEEPATAPAAAKPAE